MTSAAERAHLLVAGAAPAGARLALEIAVTGAAGARVARDGGADRVELCSALELGGVTPSDAAVAATAAAGLPVQVLVRCRPGDFVHDDEEVALMAAEVRGAVAAGAAGVVVGVLDAHGALHAEAMRRLVGAARDAGATAGRPVDVTLHRAIDQSADPVATAVRAAALGVTRILTSGGAPSAPDGAAVLRAIAAAVPGVEVMAGGGVRPEDVPALAATGIAAVHLSAKRPAPPRRAGTWVPMGAAATAADADRHFVTSPGIVAAARHAVDALA
ncbi:copper homeostasis protein CutC [Actinacidiphila rubida]|uniref:PF03932 family protein CutC n=1 Tax=Actinacidiphila rubida TaxID=310780 RepID=A0A1H8FWK5_9ACTN|nr:copper homeostasis protein [Actinacidiphila rubida]